MLSQAVEDYLKTIYKLQDEGAVSTTDIARALDVSSASVTNMVKRLSEMKMVAYQSYKGVRLTEAGEKIALEIIRHHRLLETYLKEVLGYSWDQMHKEAEQLEHHISEEFEDKIDELLGYPTHDPHGHPIPTRDLQIVEATTIPLTEAKPGQTVHIQHVSDDDSDLLHYLEDLGLLPQASVDVLKKAPFNGPLTLRVGGEEHIVGHEVASNVFVAPEA
ncbi:MAG TPA: metal-dependent transcriptional regulator [Rhodothermales bacterium]|nr:metal-dependent transcriptional regulator [Rhodothermales bacterium]